MGSHWIAAFGASLGACLVMPATAQTAPSSPADRQIEEIVVTARRSGAPVWRVTSPATTLILVGSLENVSRETRWDPTNLTAALRMADRVIFPQEEDFDASPVKMIGYLIKFLRMAKLPKGQSLANMMRPDQFQRLVGLQKRGILKPGFERTHPLHLALHLDDVADGKKGYGPNAVDYVMKAVKKYKLKQVPIPRRSIKQPINALFKSRPEAHVPCLMAYVSLMEAGGAQAVKGASDAWAQRRVPEAVSALPTKVFNACSLDEYVEAKPDWRGATKRLMKDSQTVVAVLDLTAVAERGGLLDEFAAAGFDIRGPAWK